MPLGIDCILDVFIALALAWSCLMTFFGDSNNFRGWGSNWRDFKARNFRRNPANHMIISKAKKLASPTNVTNRLGSRCLVVQLWTRTSQLQRFVGLRGFDRFVHSFFKMVDFDFYCWKNLQLVTKWVIKYFLRPGNKLLQESYQI